MGESAPPGETRRWHDREADADRRWARLGCVHRTAERNWWALAKVKHVTCTPQCHWRPDSRAGPRWPTHRADVWTGTGFRAGESRSAAARPGVRLPALLPSESKA